MGLVLWGTREPFSSVTLLVSDEEVLSQWLEQMSLRKLVKHMYSFLKGGLTHLKFKESYRR